MERFCTTWNNRQGDRWRLREDRQAQYDSGSGNANRGIQNVPHDAEKRDYATKWDSATCRIEGAEEQRKV